MSHVLSEIINHAFGIVLSPVPIISVILILLTNRARRNSVAYVGGWLFGLTGAILLGIGLALIWRRTLTVDSIHTGVTVNFVLSAIFLVMSIVTLLQQPNVEKEDELPDWAQRIDELRPVHAAGLGFVGSGLTPKNVLLTLSATFIIVTAGASTTQTAELLFIFIFMASMGILTPLLIRTSGGDRATAALERWKARLIRHRYIVLALVFFMMSATMFSKGLAALAS
jgi:hypothetical protein